MRALGHAPEEPGEAFFSTDRRAVRERSTADAVTLVADVAALSLISLIAVPESGFEKSVIRLVNDIPDWLGFLWRLGVVVLALWTLTVLAVSVLRRRVDVLVDIAAAAVTAVAAGVLAVRIIEGSWPDPTQMVTGGPHGAIPLASLAVGATVTYAAAPHLTRPYRRFGLWAITAAAAAVVLLGGTTPVGAIVSLLLGGAAASFVHLLLGAGTGHVTAADVTRSLGRLAVHVTDLVEVDRRAGVVLFGGSCDGDPVRVKVHGRDARDAQMLSRLWRALWYRGAAPTPGTRKHLVEHEAFLTLFAAAHDVAVPTVLTAGVDDRKDALIAVVDSSAAISDCDRDEATASLAAIWSAVGDLHDIGVALRSVSESTFGLCSDGAVVRDLGAAAVTRNDSDFQKDRAQVLVTTAVAVGVERAVVAAGDALGPDGVEAMLPYLQTAALTRPLRRALKAAEFDMDALRSATAAVAGVEVPEVAKLQRVSTQSLVTAALLALVAFALLTALADVDLTELWETIKGAQPVWVLAALLGAQTPFAAQAVATRGATPAPVPLGPLTLLQSGVAFVALAVPSTAGRLALDVRFFQRQGLPATSALSIAAIDSFSGFLVQVSLLVLTLWVGLGDVHMSFDLDSHGGSGNLLRVLMIAAVVLLLLAVLAIVLPMTRRRILDRVRPALDQVRDTMRSLRSPTKIAELFGGNLANQLLYATALGLSLEAFGGHLDLATLVVVYVAAALFGGLMPVPGGIGVVVGALTAGLVAAGVDNTTATATAILFRLLTFYLPPLWGWVSLRWLRHHDYL